MDEGKFNKELIDYVNQAIHDKLITNLQKRWELEMESEKSEITANDKKLLQRIIFENRKLNDGEKMESHRAKWYYDTYLELNRTSVEINQFNNEIYEDIGPILHDFFTALYGPQYKEQVLALYDSRPLKQYIFRNLRFVFIQFQNDLQLLEDVFTADEISGKTPHVTDETTEKIRQWVIKNTPKIKPAETIEGDVVLKTLTTLLDEREQHVYSLGANWKLFNMMSNDTSRAIQECKSLNSAMFASFLTTVVITTAFTIL
eukprot:XP_001608767.1 hypothetical protein [Babesia bovis T2Bo]